MEYGWSDTVLAHVFLHQGHYCHLRLVCRATWKPKMKIQYTARNTQNEKGSIMPFFIWFALCINVIVWTMHSHNGNLTPIWSILQFHIYSWFTLYINNALILFQCDLHVHAYRFDGYSGGAGGVLFVLINLFGDSVRHKSHPNRNLFV